MGYCNMHKNHKDCANESCSVIYSCDLFGNYYFLIN